MAIKFVIKRGNQYLISPSRWTDAQREATRFSLDATTRLDFAESLAHEYKGRVVRLAPRGHTAGIVLTLDPVKGHTTKTVSMARSWPDVQAVYPSFPGFPAPLGLLYDIIPNERSSSKLIRLVAGNLASIYGVAATEVRYVRKRLDQVQR